MKKNSTVRALLLSVLSLLVCASMLIGTTFAWFTDSVVSKNNIIKSGNLDVELYYATSWADAQADTWTKVTKDTDIFGYDNWEPGFTKIAYFKVVNEGSLALKYQLSADVYSEEAGVNKAGDTFLLSDYIETAIVNTDADRDDILAMTGVKLKNSIDMKSSSLESGAKEVVGLAIWMPETVGNEANHNGTKVPSITFGINLLATQLESENDSFGTDYDKPATYPIVASGFATVDGASSYEIDITKADGGKIGSAIILDDSVDADAQTLSVSITERTSVDSNVTVGADQGAKTFDIEVEGLVDGNTTPVKVEFYVGTGLTNVVLYHNDVEVTNAVYNANNGNIVFESTDFSPYTVVYSEAAEDEDDGEDEGEETPALPVAIVTESDEYVYADIDWESYGQWSPTEGLDSYLEAAYTFECEDSAEEANDSYYADWICDFYVKLDKDLGANQIFLGGNYGDFGWIGFHNGDLTLEANTEIPLLGSVTGGWTYAEVAEFVGTFICGVGDVDNALEGATFTVTLRLTNPDDETEFHNISTITHTFDDKTVVSTGDELQDAIDNGESNIVLGDDIDLSEGLVIE